MICDHIASHPDGLTGRISYALLTGATLAWVGDASSGFTLVVVATERFTVPSCILLGTAGNLCYVRPGSDAELFMSRN